MATMVNKSQPLETDLVSHIAELQLSAVNYRSEKAETSSRVDILKLRGKDPPPGTVKVPSTLLIALCYSSGRQ